MKNVLNLVYKKIQYLIIGLIIIVILFLITFQNSARNNLKTNNIELINNLYFNKTLKYFYSNLNPKNKEINHRILEGENINKILKKYNLDTKENEEISKVLFEVVELNSVTVVIPDLIVVDSSPPVTETPYPIVSNFLTLL